MPGEAARDPARTESTQEAVAYDSTVVQPAAPSPAATSVVVPAVSSVRTPQEALARDQLERTRMFCRYAFVFSGPLLVALPFIHGDRTAKLLFGACLGVMCASSAWLLRTLRTTGRFEESRAGVVAAAGAFTALAGIHFFGVFSPAASMMPFVIFAVGSFYGLRTTVIVYAIAALGTAAITYVHYGLHLGATGPYLPADMDPRDVLAGQVVIQALFLVSFLLARASRRHTVRTLDELQATVRDVARREALLHEAREELARALQLGGPGRFTDQTLGSFVLGNVIGRGAMGEVYEARGVADGKPAAVKLLHRHLLRDPAHVARFVREARLVAGLRTPHVVRVLEVSDETAPLPYIAMERLHGEDLAETLRRSPRLDVERTGTFVREVAAGIAVAHGAGIVHRDLNPQNAFHAQRTGQAPVWTLLDFGLSKLRDQGATLTHGGIVGTPAYMAPEQARGEPVDERADVYAIGALAYRALTGRPPFSAPDVPSMLYEVAHSMPPRPGVFADLPRDLELVLALGLAKSRGDRFASAESFAHAFAAGSRGELDEALRERAEALLRRQPWAG